MSVRQDRWIVLRFPTLASFERADAFPIRHPFWESWRDSAAPRLSTCYGAAMNEWRKLGRGEKARSDRMWVRSDLGAFGQFQSVLHVNAQVAHRAVDLGMAEKDLNGAEVASRLVDDRCFRAP